MALMPVLGTSAVSTWAGDSNEVYYEPGMAWPSECPGPLAAPPSKGGAAPWKLEWHSARGDSRTRTRPPGTREWPGPYSVCHFQVRGICSKGRHLDLKCDRDCDSPGPTLLLFKLPPLQMRQLVPACCGVATGIPPPPATSLRASTRLRLAPRSIARHEVAAPRRSHRP
jgi:hypothetical protein